MSVARPNPNASELIHRKVEAFCLRQGFFPCRRLLIALSGGADSVSLLHIMKALQPRYGYTLSAMHLNHMIRGEEAARDEAFCRSLCEAWSIEFESFSIDIPALSAAEHRGLEECARYHRYKALETHAEMIGAERIATAHTATDQLETVLMQLVRGSATAGGIQPMRGKLIRPLLELTREDIMAYIAENHLAYVDDSSNADDRYTRNYVRHTIVPALKAMNPNVENAIGRFAEIRLAESTYLDSQAMRLLNPADLEISSPAAALPISVELAKLQAMPTVLRSRALALLCTKGGISGLNHAHFEAIDHLIMQGRAGSSLSLPHSTQCRIEQGCFCLLVASKPSCEAVKEIIPFELKLGENPLPDGSVLFAYFEMNDSIEKYIKEKQIIYKLSIKTKLNFGKISNVIRVRSRQTGDRILCGGMHRHIKKCFCDLHIPVEERPFQPILCDDDGILWIPALKMIRDGIRAQASDRNNESVLHLIYFSKKEGRTIPD